MLRDTRPIFLISLSLCFVLLSFLLLCFVFNFCFFLVLRPQQSRWEKQTSYAITNDQRALVACSPSEWGSGQVRSGGEQTAPLF